MTQKTQTAAKPAPRFFKTPAALRAWLTKNHDKATELWIGFYRKSSGKKTIGYSEALDQALCFGWIDGIKKSVDEISFTHRFTPRKLKSNWSKVNTKHIERLIEAGLMMPPGLREVEQAKKDGRWTRAYDSPSAATVPEDFLKELAKHKKAKAFFEALEKRNVYAITYRLQNSKKPETRQRWIARIIEMLNNKEKFHT
jgi:uncharacterized protein YdeI (YjbR/CyaY-like superfamily)